MRFGSFVYGTSLPSSDQDYKGVFIPDAQDLVLQRPAKHIKNSSKKDDSKRNTSDDIDEEFFSIQTFMELLRQGQTAALEMLFTPKEFYCGEASREWEDIHTLRDQFLHKGTSAFVGYTKAQASKYGQKGTKLAALKATLDLFKGFDKEEFLGYYDKDIRFFVSSLNSKEAKIIDIPSPSAQGEMTDIPHLSISNKKVGFTCTVQYAKTIYQLALNKYGHRTMLAEKNEGVDWKSTAHAVRIASEAKELLLTRHITLPRPEKDLLLQIRKGELPYKQVEKLIDQGLEDIIEAEKVSTLPRKPNHELYEEIVSRAHWGSINNKATGNNLAAY